MTGSPTAKYKDVRQQKTDEILNKLDTHGLVSASVPSTNFMSHRPPFNRDEALENKVGKNWLDFLQPSIESQ